MQYYLQHDIRPNTRKTYSAHDATFRIICRQLAIDGARPLSEVELCRVVTVYARSHKVTTVAGFISAVGYNAATAGHGDLPRGTLFARTMKGINNVHADQVATPKTAITLSDMISFHCHIDHTTFEGARDWCACTFAFFGLLRINEYANGHLQHGHVRHTAAGVKLNIVTSKTSLRPVRIDIAERADVLCPSRALSNYLGFFVRFPALPHELNTPLFITRRKTADFHAMTDIEFTATVRRLIQLTSPGCDASQYAGHSFRRGGTSALKLAGVDDSVVQLHGRWKSDAYRRYIDVEHDIALRLLATQSIPSVNVAPPTPPALR